MGDEKEVTITYVVYCPFCKESTPRIDGVGKGNYLMLQGIQEKTHESEVGTPIPGHPEEVSHKIKRKEYTCTAGNEECSVLQIYRKTHN